MSMKDQKFASHKWTPKGSKAYEETLCGVCPCCRADGEHTTAEWSCGSGDGETQWLEWECKKCNTWWSDCYQVTRRITYLDDDKLCSLGLCEHHGTTAGTAQPADKVCAHKESK